ncbi:unnamed protein product [Closterium sp. NIES-64]|nr:unnamed protein product [Closterium sp. NIES-64]
MTVNATVPRRPKRSPVQWTETAHVMIYDAITALQHPRSCDDAKLMVVEADVSGLMWNFRSFVRALSLGPPCLSTSDEQTRNKKILFGGFMVTNTED